MTYNSHDEWIWWKHGVFYHIYPLSFFDSNNDGFGDLRGIMLKLDYLKELGVDAIWLSPIFLSPGADCGYDISDYYTIDPKFGTIDDFRKLREEAHHRNIKVVLDMVLNHTSNKHPWFIESASDKKSLKRDWYIWKSGKGNRKPNNWKTAFGGSCWEYHKGTGQYYLHSFLKEQPDLNWRNKEVRKEMFRMLRYWLEEGVDGFRFDVINFIVKDKKLRNNPFLHWMNSSRKLRTRNHPRSYKIIRTLRKLLDKYPDKMSVGEVYTLPPGDAKLSASYLANGENSLHLAFDFSLIFTSWNARAYYKVIDRWQKSIPEKGWPCNVFSNHDLLRFYNRSRFGFFKKKKTRIIALLLMTLRGTPFLYYGDEIGMKNSSVPLGKMKDKLGKKYWPLYRGRDRSRTPMQWNSYPNAGFSVAEPWLPVDKNFAEVNVESQKENPDSVLNFYRSLIMLRKSSAALHRGNWIALNNGSGNLMAYMRTTADERILVLINFSPFAKHYVYPLKSRDKLLLSTHKSSLGKTFSSKINLKPFEGLVFKLNENK
jgi:alpha-glucosidase